MQTGARLLIGQHDFTTFRAAECQAKSPVKTLDVFDVCEQDSEICFSARARSFLHHQVRSMVGTLKAVGEGRFPPEHVARILAAKDRTACGPVAPPEGLTLSRVEY
jgi:tRNA pseudouridine38-40 synthase